MLDQRGAKRPKRLSTRSLGALRPVAALAQQLDVVLRVGAATGVRDYVVEFQAFLGTALSTSSSVASPDGMSDVLG